MKEEDKQFEEDIRKYNQIADLIDGLIGGIMIIFLTWLFMFM